MIPKIFRHLLLALTLALAAGAPAATLAQDSTSETPEIDYDAWEAEAERVRGLLDAGTASSAFLQNLREGLVDWRARFLAAQDANSARIDTIQAQIDALGPAPAEGETELGAVAQRREALQAQLNEAQIPRLNAVEAYSQADGLIGEIDALLRDRQTRELLERGPVAVNPVNWPSVLPDLGHLASAIRDNFATKLNEPGARERAIDRLPIWLGGFFIGSLLIVRGRPIAKRFAERLRHRSGRRGSASIAFLISLGQFLVPMAGFAIILATLISSALVDDSGAQLIWAVFAIPIALYFGRWLGGWLFPANPELPAAFDIAQENRASVRQTVFWIGGIIGIGTLTETLVSFGQVSPASRSVLLLLVYAALGYFYWRLAKLLLAPSGSASAVETAASEAGDGWGDEEGLPEPLQEPATRGFNATLVSLLARLLVVVAVVGPLLAAVGYTNASEAVMVPTALTLGVLGVIVALQVPIRDLYSLVARTSYEGATEALIPVLINLLLVFLAVPVIALIWGVRTDQLLEIYSTFWEGFSVGETQITPSTMLLVIVVFLLGFLATRLLQGALNSTILPRTKLDTGARNALTAGVGYVGIALAVVIAITTAGIDLTALGFVFGALSVGIGFGLQNVVSNFVSGIILLIERPISEGDLVEVGGFTGTVKDISVRSTRIETFDKTDVIVPNADFISGTVTNWTRSNVEGRAIITVGVAYGTDTRKVQKMLLEIAKSQKGVLRHPEPAVDFLGFGADSLDFRIRIIVRDIAERLNIVTEIHHLIAERFHEEGIEIPFAQRDIWLRNPEALPGGAAKELPAPEVGEADGKDTGETRGGEATA